MIGLGAALKRRRLEEQSGSISRSNVNTTEQCFFSGGNDLMFNILVRLPVEFLMKLKIVCRYWKYLFKHSKSFIDLHFTWSKTRLLDEHTFLIYPTCDVDELVPIKRFSFSRKDLRFEDSLDHTAAAVVTSNNVTLNEGPMYMLEPVNGLVCFVKGGGGAIEHYSVLVYNPSTLEKSPWIDTLTSAVFRKLFGLNPVEDCGGKRPKSSYKYMFGFGIDPTMNEHKVLCMIEITVPRIGKVKSSHELVFGVFTVGKNTWRMIQVPPGTAITRDSVHVCGSIYWMPSKKMRSQNVIIMVFDLGSETFRWIKIPNFILDLWSSIGKKQLLSELVEVDGHLALLTKERDGLLNLWIYNVEKGSSVMEDINWIQETMQLPCSWDKIHKLTFKTITGTSLVLVKISREYRHWDQYRSEYLHYYDRKEKKYYQNSFEILLEPTGTSDGNYSITPFFDTLFPVQTIQHGKAKKKKGRARRGRSSRR